MAAARAIAAVLMLCGLARADVAQALQGRLEGHVRFLADHLTVGDKSVRWEDLLYVVQEPAGRWLGAPQAVRLTNGEVWGADILGLSAKKLQLRFALFGKREIDPGLVAALDFLPRLPADGALKAKTLYREEGEPIPGQLLWVDERRIAIDSPLGVLTVPRQGVSRYVFSRGLPLGPKPNEDEVGLVDGTRLRGTLKPGARLVELEHAVLGKLSIPEQAVQFIRRHPPSALYLAEVAFQSVDAAPLVSQPVPPEKVEYEPGAGPEGAQCPRGLRIWPKCTVRYGLARPAGQKLAFRAAVGPVDGARGDVRVRISAAGKALFEKDFAPEDKAEALSLDVPQGDQLAIEVDFGARMRFPCGIALGEPHLVFGR